MKVVEDNPLPYGELTLQLIAQPKDTNASGDISGGWVIAQMDLAAAQMASRIAKGRTVTMAIESMAFISPVTIGAQVYIYTHVLDVGRSSIKLNVEVWTQGTEEIEARKVSETVIVHVAIDANGRIRPVPEELPN